MNARYWLDDIRKQAQIIRSAQLNLDIIKKDCEYMYESPRHYKYMNYHNVSDPTANTAIKILEIYDKKRQQELDDIMQATLLIDKKEFVIKTAYIESYIDENEKNTLLYYYVRGMSVPETAKMINYSVRHTGQIKCDAIKNLNEYFEKCIPF